MTTSVPKVTRLLMRICASRHDTATSSEKFVAMLEDLLDLAVAQNETVERETAEMPDETSSERAENDDQDQPSAANGAQPIGRHKGRRRTTYDDRVRIRMRADQARGDKQHLPPGFVAGLAAEYHVSEQTIYNILQGER